MHSSALFCPLSTFTPTENSFSFMTQKKKKKIHKLCKNTHTIPTFLNPLGVFFCTSSTCSCKYLLKCHLPSEASPNHLYLNLEPTLISRDCSPFLSLTFLFLYNFFYLLVPHTLYLLGLFCALQYWNIGFLSAGVFISLYSWILQTWN